MHYGFIAFLVGMGVDYGLSQMRQHSLSIEEYRRLTYRGSGHEFYVVLSVLVVLFALEGRVDWNDVILELIAFGLLVTWVLYGRFRVFYEARTRGLNQRYVDLSLGSLAVMLLASGLLLGETISKL